MVTLWPSFPHFIKFANDKRISGIRLNSAMISNPELEKELKEIKNLNLETPLYFDAKGRQPRITWVDYNNKNNLDLKLNHPISVKTPVRVLFKAGADSAILEKLEEGGQRLIFRAGPAYMVSPGESIHVLHPSFCIDGPLFTDIEKEKIEKVRTHGFARYFLSYVECQNDIDEFQELIGKNVIIMLKIENQRGLDFVANYFKKTENLILVAARGDLYIELSWPHHILKALKFIIEKDSEACVGSRILLSVVNDLKNHNAQEAIKLLRSISLNGQDTEKLIEKALLSVINRDIPSCADFCELAWLYDIGYRNMMLCDELCLKEDLLDTAVSAFDAFRLEK
ncbi:MAG: pyruvate kinase [Patescibacteria group bacterium]